MIESHEVLCAARPRVAFVGGESLVVQCAEIALEAGCEVVAVASLSAPIVQWASDRGIPAPHPLDGLGPTLVDLGPDVLFSVANERLLGPEVLAAVGLAVNFHDGPLPAYAGLGVTSWAIANGESRHGVTWHIMTAGVDDGDVIVGDEFEIVAGSSALELNARCYEAGLATFPMVLAAVLDRSPVSPQPPGSRHIYGRYERPLAFVDPNMSAHALDRMVRALSLGTRVRNRLGAVRWLIGDRVVVVDRATPDPVDGSGRIPAEQNVRIACADGSALVIAEVSTSEGVPLDLDDLQAQLADAPPSAPPEQLVESLRSADADLARHETFWADRLASCEPTLLPLTVEHVGEGDNWESVDVLVPSGTDSVDHVAAIAFWLARTAGSPNAVFAVSDPATSARRVALHPLVRTPLVAVELTLGQSFAMTRVRAASELDKIKTRGSFLGDLIGRDPRTRGRLFDPHVAVDIGGSCSTVDPSVVVQFQLGDNGVLRLRHRAGAVAPELARRWADQLEAMLAAAAADPDVPVEQLPMLGDGDTLVLDALNDTARDHDDFPTVDAQFRARVERAADDPALTFDDRTWSYAELQRAATNVETRLRAAGAGPGRLVGIAARRGQEMVAAVLGVLGCGAAYVPLDPSYPTDRLRYMIEDSGLRILVAEPDVAAAIAHPDVAVVSPAWAVDPIDETSVPSHAGDDLAYVIYTSGSTGAPKGVMLEHRNVVNFFAAMDKVIDHDPPGVWLAVTSLSFDISVLELLWTLTRGFHVVLSRGDEYEVGVSASRVALASPLVSNGAQPVAKVPSFSLFYFAAGDSQAGGGYRLLLEGARFADLHDFEAVWTPERHFHEFGGSYPNPSVTGAAVAAVTSRVAIRAGSVVLPLHSPIRIAEEWAVVDNLSNGRVAISFAAGWQRNDFVLNPDAYATAKESLGDGIEQVRRLWRGESIAFPGPGGADIEVRTLPRPVQPELPIWLTSAGSPSTFERAGNLGVNVLTHLLGQSVEQLRENIALYRASWLAAGHEGDGRVTLMLHTFLDRDTESAKEAAREPLKGYLRTATSLLKDMASAFPTFAGAGADADEAFRSLSDDELSQLLDMATSRYLETSGLFGTPDDAAEMVLRLGGIDVDEVACLIDFGIPDDAALAALELLDEARRTVNAEREVADADVPIDPDSPAPADDRRGRGFASLVADNDVTHLQCTPSLAAMLVADPVDRSAVERLRHVMVGGEAFPVALAAELRTNLKGRLTNMYGPTETTIWSLVHEIDDVPSGSVPIGRPIDNTVVHVLDPAGARVPVGVYGELHVGGAGVARGYLGRDELTASRFVDRGELGRLYATGDIVRVDPTGLVEFSGRIDNQVKIRGHRIELGEIETVLDSHPDVVQSVVVVDAPHGETRLDAFVVSHGDVAVTADALRAHVAATLPAIMVPATVTRLDSFPLTPNGKIDRNAVAAAAPSVTVVVDLTPPANDLEALVATVWAGELGHPVGRNDNFFEVGGHSLVAVKVFRRLYDETSVSISLTDIFRFPTVGTFGAYLATLVDPGGAPSASTPSVVSPTGTDRGAMRRQALARRGAAPDPAPAVGVEQ